jgi:hypothetical protein
LKSVRCFRRNFIDTLLMASFLIGNLYATTRVAFAPRNPADGVAVVFSPWTDAVGALDRATAPGGRFVRYGGYSFIVVVIPEDSDYVVRISSRGALFVLDPQALAACFGESSQGDSA